MKKRLILIFSLLLYVSTMFAQQSLTADSLRSVMSAMSDPERLEYLEDLVSKYVNTSLRKTLADLCYEEGVRQKNDEVIADAYYLYARHYYADNLDSLSVYVELATPLFLKIHRHEDLFRMIGWEAYAATRAARQEQALEAINEIRELSKVVGYEEGDNIADQALADFYLTNGLDDDGENLYVEVLERIRAKDNDLVKQLYILRQLITRLTDPAKRLKYIQGMQDIVDYCKANGIEALNRENPLYDIEYSLHRYYTLVYLVQGDAEKMWEHLESAQKIADDNKLARAAYEMPQVYIVYYQLVNNPRKVLEYAEILEVFFKERSTYPLLYNALSRKAQALRSLGELDKSIDTYVEMLAVKDSINALQFNERLADVRTKYEVEQLELENRQMEERANQTRLMMMMLVGSCIFLVIVVILLIYMMQVVQRNRKSLRFAKEKAEEADRMKSAFLANMNHEIRTPLNAIVGFSQVLIEEEDRNNREEYARIIESNNELLQRLIGDVLDISKIESNSMSLVYSKADVTVVMREVYNMIYMRAPQNVELILDPCIPLTVETDKNRLVQILTNLLTNAVKHTKEGHIRFGFTTSEATVKFYIEDTGEGMSEDKLSTIFDRFVQLENGHKGVGLGLAISKGLVTKMGGEIWVASVLGKGSTFYFTIPYTSN